MYKSSKYDGSVEDYVYLGKFSSSLQCNTRGEATYKKLIDYTGENIKNKEILDIGSGLGGALNAFAKHDNYATGIEFTKHNYDISLINCNKYISDNIITIYNEDASALEYAHRVNKKFDFIILEDSIEHIYEIYNLLNNIKIFSKEGTFIYFNIPNRLFPDYIINEAHNKKLGISLLPPDLWTKLGINPGFSVYYRPYELIELLFDKFGFKFIKKIWIKDLDYNYCQKQNQKIDTLINESPYKDLLYPFYKKYRYIQEHDYKNLSKEQFKWKYCTPSWRALYRSV